MLDHANDHSRRRPGPSSRDEVLARVDGRTRVGRLIRQTEADLIADLGGEDIVTAAERLLISAAAVKRARIALLADRLIGDEEPTGDEHKILAWTNSLRLDLIALGLKRRAKEVAGGPRSRFRELASSVSTPIEGRVVT